MSGGRYVATFYTVTHCHACPGCRLRRIHLPFDGSISIHLGRQQRALGCCRCAASDWTQRVRCAAFAHPRCRTGSGSVRAPALPVCTGHTTTSPVTSHASLDLNGSQMHPAPHAYGLPRIVALPTGGQLRGHEEAQLLSTLVGWQQRLRACSLWGDDQRRGAWPRHQQSAQRVRCGAGRIHRVFAAREILREV
ncbi:hypothetical protein B0H11DRAFT_1980307 [Mycena galericulata]|nr:hypothetical protein B0H11DRAFT_1980307 [Mycena galericulata]